MKTDNQIIGEFMGIEIKYLHNYPGILNGEFHGTSDCLNGCGAWMGSSRSGAPKEIDPFGKCPNSKGTGFPDYSSDSAPRKLLHEVELKLAEEGLLYKYTRHLGRLTGFDCDYGCCNLGVIILALAPIKVKAIVETLKGRE